MKIFEPKCNVNVHLRDDCGFQITLFLLNLLHAASLFWCLVCSQIQEPMIEYEVDCTSITFNLFLGVHDFSVMNLAKSKVRYVVAVFSLPTEVGFVLVISYLHFFLRL